MNIDCLSPLLVGKNPFSFSDSAESTFELSLNAGVTYPLIDKDNPSSWWRRSDLEHRIDTVAFGSLSDFKSLFYGEVKGHTGERLSQIDSMSLKDGNFCSSNKSNVIMKENTSTTITTVGKRMFWHVNI